MITRIPIEVEMYFPGYGTNAYVVGESDGLLLDPADRSPELDEAVADRVEHVALTHHHPDHVDGVEPYVDEWDLTAWARAGRVESFVEVTGVEPDRTFRPGDVLPFDGGLEVLDTPGHAVEHVAFVHPDGMISGDLALAEGSVVIRPHDGDMRAYLTSLRRVMARRPERLYPGHGDVIDDPRDVCLRLLSHRRYREQRVREAIEAGHGTPDEIVEAIYEKDISDVYPLAKAIVTAHIEKLAIQGLVAFDGEVVRRGASPVAQS